MMDLEGMEDFLEKTGQDDGLPVWKGDVGKALVTFAHGLVFFLCFAGPVYMSVCDPQAERFFEPCPGQPDGVYLFELFFEDDGPGDSPGTRETVLSVKSDRPVTVEEWNAHVSGEWPWNEDGSGL